MVFEKHRAWVVGNDSATVGGVSYGVRDQVFGAVRPSQRGARRVIFSSWLARVFGLGLRGPGLLCVLSLDGPAQHGQHGRMRRCQELRFSLWPPAIGK